MCPLSLSNSDPEEAPSSSPEPAEYSRPSSRRVLRPTPRLNRHSRSARPARTTPSPSGSRRSVASMKSLMPLTLSPACPSLWSNSSTEEAVDGDRVDDYFPEVLARDLELSSTVFASRRMTAGMPSSTLSSDDRSRYRACRLVPSVPYLAASAHVQSLGPIEERSSRVSFLDPQGLPRLDDNASDLDSRTTAQTSDDTVLPSIRQWESLMTMATSLASTNWKPSLKSPAPSDGLGESSWIDGDSDGEDENKTRLPSPPVSDLGSGLFSPQMDMRVHWSYGERPLHRKSHSVSGGSPRSSRRKMSGASLEVPSRPASTAGVRGHDGQEPRKLHGQDASSTAGCRLFSYPEEVRPRRARRGVVVMQKDHARPLQINVVAEPSPVSDEFPAPEIQAMLTAGIEPTSPPPPAVAADTQPPCPRPALRSVQSWLNGSLQPYPRPLPSEDLTKVVPLPPEAMETLRVSIACFPETILLSSSLTVETIRTYSRKVRQPSIELLRSLPVRSPSPESPTQPSRKSLWRKVVPYKKGRDVPEPKPRSHHHSGANSIDSTTSGSLGPPKPWEPFKYVFGCCSDYICDALYAHIVAYNYVSALVARNPQAPPKPGRNQPTSTRDSQQEDIPKKAASLLGLAGAGDAAAGFSRLTRRLGTPLGSWAKEEMITCQPTAASNHENMQQDLLRCISRLVATAKLVAESGTGDETMVKAESEDTDMFFVRSLRDCKDG